MNFSVVTPIHNEAKRLPYSLPLIYQIEPEEVILIFDRCTDRSLQVAKEISQKFGYQSRTKFIELNQESPGWNRRLAFLYRYGYRIARNDIILTVDADIILDKRVKNYLNMIGKNEIRLISFSFIPYPYTIQFFIGKLISLLSPKKGESGIHFFSKQAWLETEDEEFVKKVFRASDTQLHLSIEKKYRREHIKTKTIHLRPREKKRDHYIMGLTHWMNIKRPLWKEIIYSIVYLRPMMVVGYFHARAREMKI